MKTSTAILAILGSIGGAARAQAVAQASPAISVPTCPYPPPPTGIIPGGLPPCCAYYITKYQQDHIACEKYPAGTTAEMTAKNDCRGKAIDFYSIYSASCCLFAAGLNLVKPT